MHPKTPVGIVHGRFQPPHNGHIRYILTALEHCEHLYIGICTPTICTKEEAAQTGFPCTQEENPFTYEQRVQMISESLMEAGIPVNRFSCIPFPSDYKNISASIPANAVFYMSQTSPADAAKADHLRSLGYQVETIITIPSIAARTRGGAIRQNIQNKNDAWRESVPEAVARHISDPK